MIGKAITSTVIVLIGLGVSTGAKAAIVPRTSTLSGNQTACTLTNPEYTLNPGGSYMRIKQGHVGFSASHAKGTVWNDPYITAGYNKSINSQACNSHATISGVKGKSYPLPAKLGRAAGRYYASVRNWTSSNFKGDTGFDIWLTRNPSNTSLSKMLDDGKHTSEIMVWVSHPHLYTYHSRGSVVIAHHRWDVIRSVANGTNKHWLRVFFISQDNRTGTVAMNNLYLNTFLSYAIRAGYLNPRAYLMSIDEGGEFLSGRMTADSYSLRRSP